jgi:type II secretory ATPase GspE/PulE/Tfp pilus assembly ATPase PilB-like protein
MDETMMSMLLGTAASVGPYVNLIKVAIVILAWFGWSQAVQWVDRDTDVVKTKREQWNGIVVLAGLVAGLVLTVLPFWRGQLFSVGVAFWVLLSGAPIVAYIIHRNGRVAPPRRILTVGHLKRLIGARAGKRAPKDKGIRVQVLDNTNAVVQPPNDYDDLLDFQAVQDFLFDLLYRRASDADMLADKEKYRLVYRVDGVATEHPDGIPTETGERIIRCLKKLAGLNVEEIRRPQTGKLRVALLGHEGEIDPTEVHTSGTTAGERLRLRIAAGQRLLRLHELGFARPRFDALRKQVLAKQRGLLLISAPPQHGLTTTQYAVLRGHDAYMNNIHSIERRPLTEVDNITQHHYDGPNTDVSYARMLQTVLRGGCDILMVGECEDRETAQLAAKAASEDRKVYMGIPAKDCFDALAKFLGFLGNHRLAARSLLGVMNQRLARVLCTECREAFQPDTATLKKLNLPADKIEKFYRPPSDAPASGKRGKSAACQKCQGTGYLGRTAFFEVLIVDPAVRKLIAEGAPMERIKAQCRQNKMYYLQEEGLLKVINGKTSMNEILRCLRADVK